MHQAGDKEFGDDCKKKRGNRRSTIFEYRFDGEASNQDVGSETDTETNSLDTALGHDLRSWRNIFDDKGNNIIARNAWKVQRECSSLRLENIQLKHEIRCMSAALQVKKEQLSSTEKTLSAERYTRLSETKLLMDRINILV